MALGGVATGSMKPQLAATTAGTHKQQRIDLQPAGDLEQDRQQRDDGCQVAGQLAGKDDQRDDQHDLPERRQRARAR